MKANLQKYAILCTVFLLIAYFVFPVLHEPVGWASGTEVQIRDRALLLLSMLFAVAISYLVFGLFKQSTDYAAIFQPTVWKVLLSLFLFLITPVLMFCGIIPIPLFAVFATLTRQMLDGRLAEPYGMMPTFGDIAQIILALTICYIFVVCALNQNRKIKIALNLILSYLTLCVAVLIIHGSGCI